MLTEHTRFYLQRIGRSIWLRPALYTFGAGFALVLGPFFDPFIPEEIDGILHENAVRNILEIIASSMLAVAIFSLGTMVSAFQIASDAATPRARPLVTQDRTAQNAISTFLGAFLFSILGIIGLSARVFSGGGRLVLFALSIILIVLVLATFIAWMHRLTNLGGVPEVIDLVESTAAKGFKTLAKAPYFGGRAARDIPKTAKPVHIEKYGYIQHIDAGALGRLADKLETDLHLTVRPGAFLHPERPVLFLMKKLESVQYDEVCRAFVVGDQRTFHTDPVYGLVVLSEIAMRALSPGINDPGTATDVIGTATRIVGEWQRRVAGAEPKVKWDRLYVPELDIDGVFEAAFGGILREGSKHYDVALRLMQALSLLRAENDKPFSEAAGRLHAETLARAKKTITEKSDIDRLTREGKEIFPADPSR